MKLERILRAVYDEPWLILPGSHASIRRMLDLKLQLTPGDFSMRDREGEGISGEKVQLPSMVIDEGVAQIPFGGVLLKGASALEKGSGGLAQEDIEADVMEAIDDPDVEALFFDVDSPGGMAMGTPELAELIDDAADKKPCWAWVEGYCCSAAYFSLAGCTQIYGRTTCEIGAVECYMAVLNSVGWFENKGLKIEIIKPVESVYAAAGYPGTDLNDAQRGELLAKCEYILGLYVDHLEECRPDIAAAAMRGQTFIGEQAIAAGFLDAVTTKAQAMRELRQWANLPPL